MNSSLARLRISIAHRPRGFALASPRAAFEGAACAALHLNFHRAIPANIGDYHDGEGRRVRKVEYNGGQIQREVVFVYSAGKLVEEY